MILLGSYIENTPQTSFRLYYKHVYYMFTKLKWPAQSLNLNSTEHLWDELESQFWVRFSCPISVPGLINGMTFPQTHSKVLQKHCSQHGRLLQPQMQGQLQINGHGLLIWCPTNSHKCYSLDAICVPHLRLGHSFHVPGKIINLHLQFGLFLL